ncbi:MAG: 16S rRNA (cytidine(1402)-2'-O)-methyltransferase [Candidatus Omnitrophota bacterium]|nr:MAG: 16S rRNA (cytidine(1402)-2'-O)-methyltransferase [Candidatus Omnitrophota bacterium]
MLYIVATPIGNLEDIALRALRTLKEADLILAEDTRKTGLLLKHFSIKKPLKSFHDHNEAKMTPWVIEELKKGKDVALVSSAGTPTISDPGYKLVRACRKESLRLTAVPGPSGVTNALSLSSCAHDKFVFLSYLPRKRGERRKTLEKIKGWQCAIVFFESPFRVLSALRDLKEIMGNKRLTIAREMTKKFEEVLEVATEEAIRHFESIKPKGEFTIVIDNKDSY